MLGVLGGLGPMATAYFLELVTRMTDAATDQEHLNMIVYSCPSIPDRTGYLLDRSRPNPLPFLIEAGRHLAEQGADPIIIPCLSAHSFYRELAQAIPAPILNGIMETVRYLKEQGIGRVGILATDGTIRTGLFQRELAQQGMTPILPSEARQADVMHLIYRNIKANLPAEMNRFHAVRRELEARGAEVILLGCTELSLIKREKVLGPGVVDALEVLARRSVLGCGGKLRPEYNHLVITR